MSKGYTNQETKTPLNNDWQGCFDAMVIDIGLESLTGDGKQIALKQKTLHNGIMIILT